MPVPGRTGSTDVQAVSESDSGPARWAGPLGPAGHGPGLRDSLRLPGCSHSARGLRLAPGRRHSRVGAGVLFPAPRCRRCRPRLACFRLGVAPGDSESSRQLHPGRACPWQAAPGPRCGRATGGGIAMILVSLAGSLGRGSSVMPGQPDSDGGLPHGRVRPGLPLLLNQNRRPSPGCRHSA